MVWQVSLRAMGAALVAAVIACPASAQADEAYLCGPDKVVYVSAADLPMKKRTDPCIAAYYGLTVEAGAHAATSTSDAKTAAASVQAELKPLSDTEIPSSTTRQDQRQAALAPVREPPRAMAGTDYRNVKILNAATPDSAWFHHNK
ncbi:MAG: hypothetical protein WBP38_03910 [Hyphomicrobium sp.]